MAIPALALFASWNSPTFAQTVVPSQVVPRDVRPEVARPVIEMPSSETSAPTTTPADSTVTVGSVSIEGAFSEMSVADARFVAKVSGKTIRVSQLLEAVRELEREYVLAGYVFARVILPPQRIEPNGAVRILIIDGWIESIDVSAVTPSMQVPVKRRLMSLVGRRHLRQSDLERALLLAGGFGGITLRSAISAGQQAGGVHLIVEGNLDRVAASLGAENKLPASLGRWQLYANAAFNNLFGTGDRAYVVAGLPPYPNRFFMVGGGVELPVGSWGATVTGDYLFARARNRATPGVPAIQGDFNRTEIGFNLPIRRTRRDTIDGKVHFDFVSQNSKATQFSADLNHDAYAAMRVEVAYQAASTQASRSLALTFSQGLTGRNATAAVPYSRQGTGNDFTTLQGRASLSSLLTKRVAVTVRARGQTSFGKPLFLSEQFALDAADAVSTSQGGIFNVDSGATLRTELNMLPAALGSHLAIAPYIFGAGGIGSLSDATALERANQKAAGLGTGARLDIAGLPGMLRQPMSIGIEFGHQFSNYKAMSGGSRVNLSASMKF